MVGMAGEGKIVALPAGRDEEWERVIELLERALEVARSGACSGVSIFLMSRDGMNHFFDGMENRTVLVGALEQMKHRALEG